MIISASHTELAALFGRASQSTKYVAPSPKGEMLTSTRSLASQSVPAERFREVSRRRAFASLKSGIVVSFLGFGFTFVIAGAAIGIRELLRRANPQSLGIGRHDGSL